MKNKLLRDYIKAWSFASAKLLATMLYIVAVIGCKSDDDQVTPYINCKEVFL